VVEIEDALSVVEGEIEDLQLHLLLGEVREGQGSLQGLLGLAHHGRGHRLHVVVLWDVQLQNVRRLAQTHLEHTSVEVLSKLRDVHLSNELREQMPDKSGVIVHGRMLNQFNQRISLFLIPVHHSDIQGCLQLSVGHKRHDDRVLLRHLSDKIDAFKPERAIVCKEMQQCIGVTSRLYLAPVHVLTVEERVVPRENVVEESLELQGGHTLEVLKELLLDVFRLEVL